MTVTPFVVTGNYCLYINYLGHYRVR